MPTRSLQDFAQPGQQPVFANAQELPLFFQNNLVDPARVVKAFHNDPQANIRVFYFQYLKLCFELENINFEAYIQKIEQIINNQQFKFMFHPDDDPQIFNDLQFKQLMMEFFGVLGQGGTTTEQAIDYYPFIDTVFVYFFRAILILTGKADSLESYLDRDEIFGFLASYFDIQLSVHDNCIKFVETDVFVYEETPETVFMAYMNYEDGPENQEYPDIVVQPSLQAQQPAESMMKKPTTRQSLSAYDSKNGGTNQAKSSYISSDFIDYTHSVNRIQHKATVQVRSVEDVKSIKEISHASYGSHHIPDDTVQQSPMSSEHKKAPFMPAQIKQIHTDNFQGEAKGTVETKQVQSSENINLQCETGLHGIETSPVENGQVQSPQKKASISYHGSASPKANPMKKPGSAVKPPTQVPIPQAYSSTSSNVARGSENPSIGGSTMTKNPFNLNVSVEFTNSITMKYMAEPYRSNVRGIRQKARKYRDSLKQFLK